MVIQLQEWTNWRIAGNGRDWEVQRLIHNKKTNADEWRGTNFFPRLDFAIAFAYERALRESDFNATNAYELVKECRRIKDELIAAVCKAVS